MSTKYKLTSYQEGLFNEVCLRLPKDKELSNLLKNSYSIEISKESVHKTKLYKYLKFTKRTRLTFGAVKRLLFVNLDFIKTQKKIFVNSFDKRSLYIIQHKIIKEISKGNFSMIIHNKGPKYIIVGNIILIYSYHRSKGVKYDF